MSNEVVTWLKTELAKFEASPVVITVETDVEQAGTSALAYIKTNGLQDLYAFATTLLAGIATGTPWGVLLTSLTAQAITAGITLAKGAEGVVLAQAQADLIAAGKIAAPVAS